MKIWVLLLFLCCGVLLVACSGKLPKIKDPETLKKECATLFQEFPDVIRTNKYGQPGIIDLHIVKSEQWTPEISAMNPVVVLKCKFGILIGIHAKKEGIEGYYVSLDSTAQMKSVEYDLKQRKFQKTNFNGIYTYQESLVEIYK